MKMEKIPSFTIDHSVLDRGVYVSRIDSVGSEKVTTFDIRMKRPNREPPLEPETQHTLEHLAATYLRNNKSFADQVLYWGPMGCLTGSYLIVKSEQSPEDVIPYLIDMFNFIMNAEEVPGTKPEECGNCTLHDLVHAKYEAAKFLTEVLLSENTPTKYPSSNEG